MSLDGSNLFQTSVVAGAFCLALSACAPCSVYDSQTPTLGADPLATALDHFYNLEYDAAQKELEGRVKSVPSDLRALDYLARVFMQREMLRRELLETRAYADRGEAFSSRAPLADPKLRQKVLGVLDELERLAQDRLKKNPRDEDALYWMGASHVSRAIYDLSLEKSKMRALGEAKEAHKYHERLLAVDPECADAYLVVGTYDYLTGSLPWYVKVVAALAGYSGDRERGLKELERAAERGRWAQTDAKTLLSILYFREKRYPDALRFIEQLKQAFPRNFLLPQEAARAYKAQDDLRSAAREYDGILHKYASRDPGFVHIPAAKIYYQAGEVYLHLGESNEALERFQKAAELNDDVYVYRAELAAAGIELKLHRNGEARRRFERVARDVPNTREGRSAALSLRSFASTPSGMPAEDAR